MTSVDWEKFNINPYNDEDVSKKTCIEEFKKYDGTSRQFVLELDRRFGYSGMMCEIVKDWLDENDA